MQEKKSMATLELFHDRQINYPGKYKGGGERGEGGEGVFLIPVPEQLKQKDVKEVNYNRRKGHY